MALHIHCITNPTREEWKKNDERGIREEVTLAGREGGGEAARHPKPCRNASHLNSPKSLSGRLAVELSRDFIKHNDPHQAGRDRSITGQRERAGKRGEGRGVRLVRWGVVSEGWVVKVYVRVAEQMGGVRVRGCSRGVWRHRRCLVTSLLVINTAQPVCDRDVTYFY